jgi:mannose-6-phosphate isomerase-like protein (cupin superfamily)
LVIGLFRVAKEIAMLRNLFLAVLVLTSWLSAQQPQTSAVAAPPAQAPREIPSNDRSGVVIDRFIGDANRSISRISHEVMLTRSMLRAGDPYKPGEPGAVLEFHQEVALATLMGKNETPQVQYPQEFFFYVESGQGRIDNGKQLWDLHEGLALLVPPNLPHRIINTSDAPLNMIMISWIPAADVTPVKDILVRDVHKLAFNEKNGHWNHMAKWIFTSQDGLGQYDRFLMVYLGPMTMGGPHAHSPGQSEIWIKSSDEDAIMMLGSEIRPMPAHTAFLAPPNGMTTHAVANLSRDKIATWVYACHLPPAGPQTSSSGGRGGRGGSGQNEFLAQAVREATVAGRPMP